MLNSFCYARISFGSFLGVFCNCFCETSISVTKIVRRETTYFLSIFKQAQNYCNFHCSSIENVVVVVVVVAAADADWFERGPDLCSSLASLELPEIKRRNVI